MNKEDLAKLLHGRSIGEEMTKDEELKAKESNLVVVYGASDDLMEFRGSINDETGVYSGGKALVDGKGLLPERDNIDDDEELEDYFLRKKDAITIEALWCKGDISWSYKTSIPHATFDIMEDGEIYCRGIVFDLNSLNSDSSIKPKRKRNSRDRSGRPSPSVSATLNPVGFEMEGNDGNMYVVAADKNGTHRWVKQK